MPVERDDAVATWRRAEARVYPAVMVNAALYEQYLVMVRAVVDELGDVRTEDDLVIAWEERRGIAAEVIAAKQPSMGVLMDKDAVRDAAFCQRHRDITREQAKDIARERLEQARRDQAEWVVLFEDVTPFGSHRLEMHVRTGHAIHASSKVDLDRPRPEYSLEVVQLDPENGAWILDRPPLMPSMRCDTEEEWRVRIDQARITFGRPT
ncbi:MAG: hypothetical protein IT200_03205 [Thermoleophilia bacterium]|nr:hypothetical protein [Thermoleophilia bacterium]